MTRRDVGSEDRECGHGGVRCVVLAQASCPLFPPQPARTMADEVARHFRGLATASSLMADQAEDAKAAQIIKDLTLSLAAELLERAKQHNAARKVCEQLRRLQRERRRRAVRAPFGRGVAEVE